MNKSVELPEGGDPFNPIAHPELVFGLVGAIGTDMRRVQDVLIAELQKVRYRTICIKVSDLFSEIPTGIELKQAPLEERYASHIEYGNKIRELIGRQDALAILSVSKIRAERNSATGATNKPIERTAYVLNQLKRPEEIQALRRIYGRGFIQISAHCPEPVRVNALKKKIAASHYGEHGEEYYTSSAHELIRTDEDEEEHFYGQRLRKTFHLADVFIDAASEKAAQKTCERFVHALFGSPFITPTRDEYGQYLAKVASLRSADLSRQVGAVVTRSDGSAISMGCNEVPKAGGGTYWEEDEHDHRDYVEGFDSSSRQKTEIVSDIFRRLQQRKWLRDDLNELDASVLSQKSLVQSTDQSDQSPLADALVTDLLEFGRIIHAEMNAITDAARHGLATKGATLYSTTFPCHICARHIIAAGILRVVYIEPYPKSYALRLYKDSISIYHEEETHKVKFESFVGIAPERYSEVFSKGKRKNDDGSATKWSPESARPVLLRTIPAYLMLEASVANLLADAMDRLAQ